MENKKDIYIEKVSKIAAEIASLYDMAYESGYEEGLRQDVLYCKYCKNRSDITYVCKKHGKIFCDSFYCGYWAPKEDKE